MTKSIKNMIKIFEKLYFLDYVDLLKALFGGRALIFNSSSANKWAFDPKFRYFSEVLLL